VIQCCRKMERTAAMAAQCSETECDLLGIYREKIENEIQKNLKRYQSNDALFRGCQYALVHGGKRFRPAITLMVGEALNAEHELTQAALTVEYLHTASLVADDLPCMDDDAMRRGKAALHKAFNEPLALLVSYALIAAGYENLSESAKQVENSLEGADRRCRLALENVSINSGIHGATGGQFLDIQPPDLTKERVREIHAKKTAALFEMAFVIGWLYGGGEIEKLDLVKKAALHYGIAFQIFDDYGDRKQDCVNDNAINIFTLFGEDYGLRCLNEELKAYKETLNRLEIASSPLIAIADALSLD